MPQMQIFPIGGPIVKPNLLFYSSRLAQSMIVNVQAPARSRFGLTRQRNSSIAHRKRPLLATGEEESSRPYCRALAGPFGFNGAITVDDATVVY